MISMHIHCKLNNVLVKSIYDIVNIAMINILGVHEKVLLGFLLADVEGEFLYKSLDSSCSMNVQRNVN